MGQWWICPQDNQVCVDDCSIMGGVDCSAIPKNVNLIFWHGTWGEILYNDRAAVREQFTDISPYLALFDQWMLVANGHSELPLTLPQARFVKTKLIDSLFASKRQAPIAYLGRQWDASDAASAAMANENAAVGQEDGVAWTPLDGPPVSLERKQFTELLWMITSRRCALQHACTRHKNNIAALMIRRTTTIPDIAAYDIKEGW